MADPILRGIVRILYANGSTAGTGFVITDDGLIATCAHVVQSAGAGPSDMVRVAFHATSEECEAQVEPRWWRAPEAEDIAILRINLSLPEEVVPLPLGNSAGAEGHPLATFGFADPKPVEGMPGKCEVVGRTTERGFPVLQLRSSEVTPGFSGAPVYDTFTRRVVGMVISITEPDRYGRLTETAFISPIETLRAVCPELRISDICPYQGLAAFTEADAEFFFGREKLVSKLVDHLRGNPRFLAVIGPSGSGKSSVVQAGLIPALRQGEVPGSQDWHFLSFRPGDDPFAALVAAGLDTEGDDLKAKTQAFLRGAHPGIRRLVLFADQFEELFALCREPMQERFLEQLRALLESSLPVTLLLTLRADFYGHLLRKQALFDWLEVGQVNVSPMGLEELQAAVQKPALKLGLRFEPGLAKVIAEDAGRIDHPLPLLESALIQLWGKRRADGTLTHMAYESVGRVAGAISQWAEDTYSGLSSGDQTLSRHIFTRLLHYGKGDTADTRRRSTLSELATERREEEQVHQLVRRLASARLLVTGEETGTETVEIIHDSLLEQWIRLKQWIAEQREFHLWRQRLDERLREWQELEDPGALLRGALLIEAEGWLARQTDRLNETEIAYIEASLGARERLRRRIMIMGLVPTWILTLVVVLIGTYVVTTLVSSSYDVRVLNYLREAGRVVSDSIVDQEQDHLGSARLVGYVSGLIEALQEGDRDRVAALAWPAAAGLRIECLIIVDAQGDEAFHLLSQEDGDFELVEEDVRASEMSIIQPLLASGEVDADPRRAIVLHAVDERYYHLTAIPIGTEEGLAGVVVVGTSIDTLLPELSSDSLADVTIYLDEGQAVASTFAIFDDSTDTLEDLSITPDRYQRALYADNQTLGENTEVRNRWYRLAQGPIYVANDRLGVFSVALPTDFVIRAGAASRNTYTIVFSLVALTQWTISYFVIRYLARSV